MKYHISNLSCKLFIILNFLFSFSSECFPLCKYCYESSDDYQDMKCILCKSGYHLIYNTSNCGYKLDMPNYYLNNTDSILYPCSIFPGTNCYECDPSSNTVGMCLTCEQGYYLNEETKECIKCNETQYPIIFGNFYGCATRFNEESCDNYYTLCKNMKYDNEIICPDIAPIYNKINKSCHEYECQKNGFEKGVCSIKNEMRKNRILFINWFGTEPKHCRFPSYNVDDSGYLLIEMTCGLLYHPRIDTKDKNRNRKLYFYNEEGRGFFDEINDIYEKDIIYSKNFMRFFSTSMVLKLNNSEEKRYLLVFEFSDYNLELFDLKTGEFSTEDLFDVFRLAGRSKVEFGKIPSIQLFQSNKENQFILASFIYELNSYNYKNELKFFILFGYLNPEKNEKINIYSLDIINTHTYKVGGLNKNMPFYIVQTKRGDLIITFMSEDYLLVNINDNTDSFYLFAELYENAFYKYFLLKDELTLVCFYPREDYPTLIIEIQQYNETYALKRLAFHQIFMEIYEGMYHLSADMLKLNENKTAFIAIKWHRREFSLLIFNFFNDYQDYIYHRFIIQIYDHKINRNPSLYSLLFQFKGFLGFKIENYEAQNGFVLFGYFNSTDPKQILNIKKDGLNYNILLSNYLTLQSNIFAYEIKGIKVLQIPNNDSGIYLISNQTKNIINVEDFLDFNTEISFYFTYNGIIKKGNYLFKFVGVLQEPTFENLRNYSDEVYIHEDKIEYIQEYNERINTNLTGRVALLQIIVLNDTKIFCDDKYNQTSLKTKEGKYLTCGNGTYYDVENENEITQLYLGINYYFDYDKNSYIKCYYKCKTCSKEYNDTNMNCDECFENYFLRNGLCLEISKCNYNYYYDYDLNLNCINNGTSCPDFKPYENSTTKECIEKCDIDEYNNFCNPTNNLVSRNETYNKIINNLEYLDIEKKLLIYNEKYVIKGNNITFIFSTSSIEKSEINNNYNTSTILLNECEDILKKKYSIPPQISIPILKIETLYNYSKNMDVYYELFNPLNLSQKLDINFCENNIIEIRTPAVLENYKIDLLKKTRELGYNILDYNDSFYTDICSVFSYNGSDFSLSERKVLFNLSEENLCMNECNQSNLDINTLRAICLCQIGNEKNVNDFNEEKENKKNEGKDIYNMITKNIDFSKASNIRVVKCFSTIFTIKLFKENYGFYIMLFMNIFNIICLILYPLPKVDKEYQKFCNEVLNQMKEIYNYYSKEYEYPINEPKIKNILNINDKNNNELKIKDNDITKSKNHKKSKKGSKEKKQ